MGRKSKGPRLWLRPTRSDGTKAAWFILDGNRQFGTGCGAEDRPGAENELAKYVQETRPVRTTYVYFITTEQPGFPIKIGVSESHRLRFSTLQIGLPYKVKVLAIVPTEDGIFERRLHRKFDHIRLCGEWFEQTPELLSFIAGMIGERRAA